MTKELLQTQYTSGGGSYEGTPATLCPCPHSSGVFSGGWSGRTIRSRCKLPESDCWRY